MWKFLCVYMSVYSTPDLENKIYLTCILQNIGKNLKQLFTLRARSSMKTNVAFKLSRIKPPSCSSNMIGVGIVLFFILINVKRCAVLLASVEAKKKKKKH